MGRRTAPCKRVQLLIGKVLETGHPNTLRRTGLEGWSLQAEMYSTFASFAEAILGRCLFGGEELLEAKKERIADLEAAQEDCAEDVGYFRDEVTRVMMATGNDEGAEEDLLNAEEDLLKELAEDLASALGKLEPIKVQLWRLKLDVGSWVPGEAALAELTKMGPPLSLFVSSEEGSGDDQNLHSRHMAACREAKAQPGKLFEEGWPNWLPSSSYCNGKSLSWMGLTRERWCCTMGLVSRLDMSTCQTSIKTDILL